jgi:hypothetical protein
MDIPQKRTVYGLSLTLLGMALLVMSAACTWTNDPPAAVGSIPTLYVSKHNYARNGFELSLGRMSVGWVIVLAGLVCGSLLLAEPNASNRKLFLTLQSAMGITVLVLAVLHVGFHPGIILALLGGLLLLGGGLTRYR